MWMSWTKVHAITERECTSFMEQHGVSRRTAEQLFGLDVLADVSSRIRGFGVSLSSANSSDFCQQQRPTSLQNACIGGGSGWSVIGRTAAAEGAQCNSVECICISLGVALIMWKVPGDACAAVPVMLVMS